MKKIALPILLIGLMLSQANAQDDSELKSKIGQMIMVGLPNSSVAKDTLIDDIQNRNLGGLVYFAYNIQSPSQITALNDELQSHASTPLFLSVDQEGGNVARLNQNNGFTSTGTAAFFGSVINSVPGTRNQAATMAGWFNQTGLNTNLAPVADVNVNPSSPAIGALQRSFSANETTVANHVIAFIEEFSNRDVITVLKHFPGHGSALADSHFGFTDITNTWQERELTPYKLVMEQFQPDMIMTGHLFHRGLDPDYPASISQKVVQELLRDSLGYNGVVISDEMFMRAIADNYTFDEAIVLAVNSGTDILLFNTNMCGAPCGKSVSEAISLTRYAVDLIARKVEEGIIEEARIEESYQRIMDLKNRRQITSIESPLAELPASNQLYQNYPNPFNPTTIIGFELASSGDVRLEIFDVLGRRVSTLVNNSLPAGRHEVRFDAGNLSGGVYLYRMVTAEGAQSGKMTLIK